MATVTLCVILCVALSVWRIAFLGLRSKPLAQATARRQEQHNNASEPGRLHDLWRAARAISADDRLGNNSQQAGRIGPKDRSKTYLQRIVALTDATETGNDYVLDVGRTRFHVRNKYVSRIKDFTDPTSAHEETCFYPLRDGMPKAEEIATALLQLKNNPALFEKWAAQNGAFKADGQAFTRPR